MSPEANPYATAAGADLARVGFIVGPTGAGKTAFAVELAALLGAEIVNADSRQLYRGMDIGTAKPDQAERARVPHHLIDVCDPDRPIDVATFQRMARAAIAQIAERRRPVLVVGGSGLYLRVLRGGIFAGPPAALEFRAALATEAMEQGVPYLHRRLRAIDPAAAARIEPNDLRRITRALEVQRLTGIPISDHQRHHRFATGIGRSLMVGLALERARLYEQIDRRFDTMIAAGLVEEVRGLIGAGCRAEAAPLQTIGYREVAAYLRGETGLAEAIERAKRASRHLAKRQLTWFRREPEVVWLDPAGGIEQAFGLFAKFFARERAQGA